MTTEECKEGKDDEKWVFLLRMVIDHFKNVFF